MTSEDKGGELPQMDEIVTEQVGARLAWFLAGAFSGGAKRKRIARAFDVSPETAKGWLNGNRPSGRHFDAMVRRWGPEFLDFIYPSPGGRRSAARLRNIETRLARLENIGDAEVVGSPDARMAFAPSGEADSQGRSVRDDETRDGSGGPAPSASGKALADSLPATGREIATPPAIRERG